MVEIFLAKMAQFFFKLVIHFYDKNHTIKRAISLKITYTEFEVRRITNLRMNDERDDC